MLAVISRIVPSRAACVASLLFVATGAAAQVGTGARDTSRFRPLDVKVDPIKTLQATPGAPAGGGVPAPRGQCPSNVSTYTDANFGGGAFTVQAGFAQGEIAAVSYTLPASAFPIKIDMGEMIFATQASSVTTTTEWSFLVWSGTPVAGTLEYEFNSDGLVLPHLVIPPGTNGVNVQVSVDPGDPEQIILQDPGNQTFTIGYRIDRHHQGPANPCTQSPQTCCNAFPTTDVSGLSSATNNWLFGLNCGSFGCPANGGWARFSQLPSFCRPSGDWVIRVTWESVNCADPVGACCLPGGGGCDIRSQANCVAAGGTYRGDNVTCANANCPPATQACCFPSTGGCLNLTPQNCASAGGIAGGAGTTCASFVCFPTGACCLPNGSCIGPVSPADCQQQGGSFQGNNTTCNTVNCPIPTGSCCFGTFCLDLSEAECATGGGSFRGLGTVCGKNTCTTTACPCDFNDSGTLNSQDFFDFLSCFFVQGCTEADYNHDSTVNSQDFFDFLACFFAPPANC